jgi:hypothetical protein
MTIRFFRCGGIGLHHPEATEKRCRVALLGRGITIAEYANEKEALVVLGTSW